MGTVKAMFTNYEERILDCIEATDLPTFKSSLTAYVAELASLVVRGYVLDKHVLSELETFIERINKE